MAVILRVGGGGGSGGGGEAGIGGYDAADTQRDDAALTLTGTSTLLFDAPLPVFVAVEPSYHNVTVRYEGPGADGVQPRPNTVVVMAVEVLWVIEVPHDRDTRVIRVLVHHIRRGEFDRQALRPLKF